MAQLVDYVDQSDGNTFERHAQTAQQLLTLVPDSHWDKSMPISSIFKEVLPETIALLAARGFTILEEENKNDAASGLDPL